MTFIDALEQALGNGYSRSMIIIKMGVCLMVLDYTNSIPLHIQLKEAIEKEIFEGSYQVEIRSERVRMDEYYVSRSTVRQAVDQLVRDGIVEKRPGKGTFIILSPVSDWLGNLNSTSEVVESMGMKARIKLVKAEIISLDDSLKERTGLDQAYHFMRIRYANHTPIGIERHYYPVDLGNRFVQFDLNKEAFYDLLERELGVKAFDADQLIKAGTISGQDAALLHVQIHSSILKSERLITDVNGEFIEFEDACYRADMYAFKINLSRKSH